MARYCLLTNETKGTIGCHVAVYQMLDDTKIRDDDRRTACGDKHLVTVGLRLRQSQNGRGRNLVRLETHQRPVDIEK